MSGGWENESRLFGKPTGTSLHLTPSLAHKLHDPKNPKIEILVALLATGIPEKDGSRPNRSVSRLRGSSLLQLMLIDFSSHPPGVSKRPRASLPFSFFFSILFFFNFTKGVEARSPLVFSIVLRAAPFARSSFDQPATLNFLSSGSRFSNSEFIFKWHFSFLSF